MELTVTLKKETVGDVEVALCREERGCFVVIDWGLEVPQRIPQAENLFMEAADALMTYSVGIRTARSYGKSFNTGTMGG